MAAVDRSKQTLTGLTDELVRENALPPEAYVEVGEESYGTPVARHISGIASSRDPFEKSIENELTGIIGHFKPYC